MEHYSFNKIPKRNEIKSLNKTTLSFEYLIHKEEITHEIFGYQTLYE